MIVRLAAAAAALVLVTAPAAGADPQGGVALGAEGFCALATTPGLSCVVFTADAVAAYRLGEDGVLTDDTQLLCAATAPGGTVVDVTCTANGVGLDGASLPLSVPAGPTKVVGGFVDLWQDYSLEVCFSATAVFPWGTFRTPTACGDYSFPVGM